MKKSTTKRALFLSFVSMFLCFTMLLGTTYAWFTDSVTSDVNTIVAGNLDVELYHENSKANGKVGTETKLFQLEEGQLWEPGAAVYENFTVANEGNLALKYKLTVEVSNNQGAKNLADVLKIGVVNNKIEATATREEVIAAVTEWVPFATFFKSGSLEASTTTEPTTDTYGVVVYWQPSDRDNDYNMNNGKTAAEQLKIDILVNLYATQMEAESDSFGTNYDAGAPWTGGQDISWYEDPTATEYVLDSAEDLAGLVALVNGTAQTGVTSFAATSNEPINETFAGKTIVLANDINLKGIEWTPIGRIGATSTDFTYSFKGTFDGNGHTIYNLKVSNEGWAGLFGIAHSATIKDLNVVGVEIESNRMAGAIVGQLYGSIDNCHVKDVKITVVPNLVGEKYDNGDKVGGIVGWLGDNGNNRTLEDCSAEDVTIKAYRDVGGIAGYVASSTTVNNNSAKSVTINVDQTTNHYGTKDFNAGYIFGRTGGTIVEGTNSVDEGVVDEEKMSSIDIKYMLGGAIVKIDPETGADVLYLLPETFEEDTFNVPAGVESIGGYAFAYNTNVETIVLPSTVTTLNDRAFRDTSASTVVLNEGLENISYQAFKNASNVTSVTIPSTVKTISKEAFQNSGVETLTIPANVTTIEYGGLRDMKNLETVTIEGDVDIPVYAFRACTNLKTVYIKGENVTFGGGSRGMIFTNKENGDGSAITVYVANETVKDRLIAADTAAKDYGGYKIIVANMVSNEQDLQAAIDAGKKNLVLTAGNYRISGDSDIQFVGTGKDTVIDIEGAIGNVNISNATVTGATSIDVDDGKTAVFENVVFDAKVGGASSGQYGSVSGDITFEGCTFERFLHFDSTHGANILIENCTFGVLGSLKVGAGADSVVVKNCTFEVTTATSIWGEKGMTIYCPATFIDCEFNNRAVLAGSNGLELTFNSCTMNNGTPVYYVDNTDGIIRGGNVPNVIISD